MTTMKKSDRAEIRISRSTLSKVPSIDVREFFAYPIHGGEFGPTQKGFLIPEELWPEFVKAVKNFNLDSGDSDTEKYVYVVTRSKNADRVTALAMKVLDSGADPSENPQRPKVKDQSYLVKCRIKGGNVVSFRREAVGENGEWLPYR